MTDLDLTIRRTIRAPAARVFAAWTTPSQLRKWWGPIGVTCCGAEVDLRPGGAYRIGNRMGDGTEIWISGRFEEVDPPGRLVYSWHIDDQPDAERVTVRFEAVSGGTEVTVLHERIPTDMARVSHRAGWHGCLKGLGAFF